MKAEGTKAKGKEVKRDSEKDEWTKRGEKKRVTARGRETENKRLRRRGKKMERDIKSEKKLESMR